jgi:hypothetical protein
LLVLHWRNRIIHRGSNAKLTKEQAATFCECAPILARDYKNLNPRTTLQNFADKTPSLKDVSSLIAMTINSVKYIDALIPAPTSTEDVLHWITELGLSEELDRAVRVAAVNENPMRGVENFLKTNCPELLESYIQFCFKP